MTPQAFLQTFENYTATVKLLLLLMTTVYSCGLWLFEAKVSRLVSEYRNAHAAEFCSSGTGHTGHPSRTLRPSTAAHTPARHTHTRGRWSHRGGGCRAGGKGCASSDVETATSTETAPSKHARWSHRAHRRAVIAPPPRPHATQCRGER